MSSSGSRYLSLALGVLGTVAVAYGMFMKEDAVFIGGIILVIAAYILIRRRLRRSIAASENRHEED